MDEDSTYGVKFEIPCKNCMNIDNIIENQNFFINIIYPNIVQLLSSNSRQNDSIINLHIEYDISTNSNIISFLRKAGVRTTKTVRTDVPKSGRFNNAETARFTTSMSKNIKADQELVRDKMTDYFTNDHAIHDFNISFYDARISAFNTRKHALSERVRKSRRTKTKKIRKL